MIRAFSCKTTGLVSVKHIQLIIDTNVVPQLTQLLSHYDVKVKKNAITVLKLILQGSKVQKQIVLDTNFISYHLDSILNHENEDFKNDAIDCLVNIAAGSKSQKQIVIDSGFLPVIAKNLTNEDFEAKSLTARLFLNLISEADEAQVKQIIVPGEKQPLFALIECQDTKTVEVSNW